jgi:YYY domain-containing protein
MIDFLKWYFFMFLLGWIVFPFTFQFLPRLRDRGYAFNKVFGLLIWGFVFWILASLHILPNNTSGVVLALIIVIGLSILILRKITLQTFFQWIKEHWKTILVVESVFFLAFIVWTAIRATNPDIMYTEKPMELAFINAILRSPLFPPSDPWLSGYSISYYYFGYTIIGLLIRVTGVASAIGYNLAVGLWFGLTAAGAYGLLFNLLGSGEEKSRGVGNNNIKGLFASLLAPIFVLLVSNIEGFLELLYTKGYFWIKDANGVLQSKFWSWLNIPELNVPPSVPFSFSPRHYNGWWWWRASRLWQDYDLTKARGPLEVIHEFPAFSYFLADLHPHVLAMPFAILTIAFAINFIREWNRSELGEFSIRKWITTLDFWILAFALGSLGFLNIWNFPIYVALVAGVFTWLQFQNYGWNLRRLWDFLRFAVTLGIAGIILYLPFYLGFSSQAGGFLPSLVFVTPGKIFWVHFLPLLVPIYFWLVWMIINRRIRKGLLDGVIFAVFITGVLALASNAMGWIGGNLGELALQFVKSPTPLFQSIQSNLSVRSAEFLSIYGASNSLALIKGSFEALGSSLCTWMSLTILLALIWSAFSRSEKSVVKKGEKPLIGIPDTDKPNRDFVLLLILLGAGLTLFPEFFFLRDGFTSRMNTIFKFYFETWILWGLAAAYATIMLLGKLKKGWFVISFIGIISVLLISLIYPLNFAYTVTEKNNPTQFSLDGISYLRRDAPDDVEAIEFLNQVPYGVIVEAVGGSYSYSGAVDYERISTHTGLPTVLGWVGHELQWRGGLTEMGTRQSDVALLYESKSWDDALRITQLYDIRYIYIGTVERSTYHVVDAKFIQNLPLVFSNTTVEIFEVPVDFR